MKIAILQSNYIPWKGYFDLINSVDVFVLYDEVQYTKNDWRNRNKIKSPQGVSWLSIPVKQTKLSQRIKDTWPVDAKWQNKHWRTLQANYAKAPFFGCLAERIEGLYLGQGSDLSLSEVNSMFIGSICEYLGIKTVIIDSLELDLKGNRVERLLDACLKLNADVYLSGPAARSYLDENAFREAGIAVEWMDYSGYPEYEILYPPFEHGVSILDLLFHTGPHAPRYMKSFNKK